MSLIAAFLIFLFGFFAPLSAANYSQAQSKATDTERKSDINTMYAKLEEFYNENGYYPTDWDFGANDIDHLTSLFIGIDEQALIDPQGLKIGTNGSDYAYQGQECTYEPNSPYGQCQSYQLSAKLEDNSSYTKASLN